MIARPELKLEDFAIQTYDKIRSNEIAGGHVNNVVYPVFYNTGRAEITHDPALLALMSGNILFVAHVFIDYRVELRWPGTVEIGTGVKAIGRSSVRFRQALFQNGICASTGESVMVQVDAKTRRPTPLAEDVKEWLSKLIR